MMLFTRSETLILLAQKKAACYGKTYLIVVLIDGIATRLFGSLHGMAQRESQKKLHHLRLYKVRRKKKNKTINIHSLLTDLCIFTMVAVERMCCDIKAIYLVIMSLFLVTSTFDQAVIYG